MMREMILLPNPQGNPETRSINLTITDEDSNPISGANVTIGDVTRTTGSAGGCSFNSITDGEHEITVTHDGYNDYSDNISVNSENTSFEVSLTKNGYKATITVTNHKGEVVEGTTVTIDNKRASTDENGVAVINGLENGEYLISCTHSHYYSTDNNVIEIYDEDAEINISLNPLSLYVELYDNEQDQNGIGNQLITLTNGDTTVTGTTSQGGMAEFSNNVEYPIYKGTWNISLIYNNVAYTTQRELLFEEDDYIELPLYLDSDFTVVTNQ